MLDVLSFGVFGVWLGYLVRAVAKGEISKGTRLGVAAAVAIGSMVLLAALGSSAQASGRWGAFAGIGAYYAGGFSLTTFEKLGKAWAGVWLFILFVVLEGGRMLMLSWYCQEFKWAC